MLPMLFDPEMLLIYALSFFSGAMFFYVASREPRTQGDSKNQEGTRDSQG
jgi:hypothetical protein